MLSFTIAQLHEAKACGLDWRLYDLVYALGRRPGENESIGLDVWARIPDEEGSGFSASNEDLVWCLRFCPTEAVRITRDLNLFTAYRMLPIFEAAYPSHVLYRSMLEKVKEDPHKRFSYAEEDFLWARIREIENETFPSFTFHMGGPANKAFLSILYALRAYPHIHLDAVIFMAQHCVKAASHFNRAASLAIREELLRLCSSL